MLGAGLLVGENAMTKTVTTMNRNDDNYYRQSEFALFITVLGSLTISC